VILDHLNAKQYLAMNRRIPVCIKRSDYPTKEENLNDILNMSLRAYF
jgi:hypothetical protein